MRLSVVDIKEIDNQVRDEGTLKGYYFITDSGLSRAGNISDVEQAVACGVEVIQYRNKNGDTREMYWRNPHGSGRYAGMRPFSSMIEYR